MNKMAAILYATHIQFIVSFFGILIDSNSNQVYRAQSDNIGPGDALAPVLVTSH